VAKKKLREYLDDGELYYVPEVFDCNSTKAAEINGFKMVMLSSSDFSCSYTGIPDLKLLSVDEYAGMTERITSMTDMPFFVDADEGFGRPLQTYHGCRRIAKAGADAILLTDAAANGLPGVCSIDEAVHRFRAARDGMEGTDCLLLARCDHSVDEDFDEFVERCTKYLEVGADMICPLEVNRSTKYGGKFNAAKKVAEHVKAPLWYPNLKAGETAAQGRELHGLGYKFVGVHYLFRAAMLAMLDAGRHVMESCTNDYIDTAYDHTGYKFYYSPMAAFLRGGEWVEREKRYVSDPNDAPAVRIEKRFTGPTDRFGPDDVK
jgi:methylisocitrate lyase